MVHPQGYSSCCKTRTGSAQVTYKNGTERSIVQQTAPSPHPANINFLKAGNDMGFHKGNRIFSYYINSFVSIASSCILHSFLIDLFNEDCFMCVDIHSR